MSEDRLQPSLKEADVIVVIDVCAGASFGCKLHFFGEVVRRLNIRLML